MQLVAVEFIKLMWKDDEFITQMKWKILAISKIAKKKDRTQSEICCNTNRMDIKETTRKLKVTCLDF